MGDFVCGLGGLFYGGNSAREKLLTLCADGVIKLDKSAVLVYNVGANT